jgi:hypothetical protein
MPPVPHVFLARKETILPFLLFARCTKFIQTTLLSNMYILFNKNQAACYFVRLAQAVT